MFLFILLSVFVFIYLFTRIMSQAFIIIIIIIIITVLVRVVNMRVGVQCIYVYVGGLRGPKHATRRAYYGCHHSLLPGPGNKFPAIEHIKFSY
jgi:hypothetical protein